MTNKEAIKYLQQFYPHGGHSWLDAQRMYARGQVPDRIKDNLRWIDDAILARMKEQANWPAGTEVIIYCHDCDRETVTAEIERKGYKVAHHVSCDQDPILAYAIHEGQYVMCKKEKIIWYQNKM